MFQDTVTNYICFSTRLYSLTLSYLCVVLLFNVFMFFDLIVNFVSQWKSLSRSYSEWYFDTWDLLGTKYMTTLLRYWNGYFANFWFVFNHSSLFVVVYCLTDDPRKGTLLNLGICVTQVLKFVCNFL